VIEYSVLGSSWEQNILFLLRKEVLEMQGSSCGVSAQKVLTCGWVFVAVLYGMPVAILLAKVFA